MVKERLGHFSFTHTCFAERSIYENERANEKRQQKKVGTSWCGVEETIKGYALVWLSDASKGVNKTKFISSDMTSENGFSHLILVILKMGVQFPSNHIPDSWGIWCALLNSVGTRYSYGMHILI